MLRQGLRTLILLILPRRFRDRHGQDLLELYLDTYSAVGSGRGFRFWFRTVGDALMTAAAMRMEGAWRRLRRGPGYRKPHLATPGDHGDSPGPSFFPKGFGADVRYAARALRKRPLFTVLAVLTLGLGIGSTTAVFSVVDGVLLRPLPYDDPSRLVNIWKVNPVQVGAGDRGAYWDRGAISYPRFRAWREARDLFEDLAVHRNWDVTMTGHGRPRRMTIGIVSASLFPVLGVQPFLGRSFHPDEEAATPGGGAQVAILSHELWRTLFSADPYILGTTIRIDRRAYEVIGIMPEGFTFRRLGAGASNGVDADLARLWVPIGVPGVDLGPGAGHWEVLGRLKPGVSVDDALVEARRFLLDDAEEVGRDVRIVTRAEAENRGFSPGILLLLGVSGLLMLIACVNTATLMVGELHSRRHDLATRFALGADSRRIARHLLTESLLIGLLGSGIGVLLGIVGTRVLKAFAPPLPGLDEVGVDMGVLAVAGSLGVICGLIFGTVPALISARNTVGFVSRSLHRSTPSGGAIRFERGLVSLQIAFTTVLLVGSGLFVRSLSNLVSVHPGFEPGTLVSIPAILSQEKYPDDEARAMFYRQALDGIRTIPGVSAVTATDNFLFPAERMNMDLVRIPGNGTGEDLLPSLARFSVAPGYFDLLGIPVLAGRGFEETDDVEDAQPAVIIGQETANRFWPGTSPIGARVRHWTGNAVVVGVVGDVKFQRLDADVSPTLFVPLGRTGSRGYHFLVNIEGDPGAVVPRIRDAIWVLDSDVPVGEAITLESLLADSRRGVLFRTRILLVFALAATVLAVSGVFGVTARSVSLRVPELAIRMALGARGVNLMAMTLRSGVLIGISGTVVGLCGAYIASRALSSFLFGVAPFDSVTYAAVVILLLSATLLACYLPARRITRLDPVEVLRSDC